MFQETSKGLSIFLQEKKTKPKQNPQQSIKQEIRIQSTWLKFLDELKIFVDTWKIL